MKQALPLSYPYWVATLETFIEAGTQNEKSLAKLALDLLSINKNTIRTREYLANKTREVLTREQETT